MQVQEQVLSLNELVERDYTQLRNVLDAICVENNMTGGTARQAKIRAIEKTLRDARIRQNGLPEYYTDTEEGAQILAHERLLKELQRTEEMHINARMAEFYGI